MKLFRAISKGFDSKDGHVRKGVQCAIRLDSTGDIRLVSAGSQRFKEPGIPMNAYELREYFTLGHSAPEVA